ncbi:MAG: hypothetical protein R3A52_04685 [Polyangiales bacterium]
MNEVAASRLIGDERPPPWARWTLFAVAAMPPLALLAYGWGWWLGAMWALCLVTRAALTFRVGGPQRPTRLALEIAVVHVALATAVGPAWSLRDTFVVRLCTSVFFAALSLPLALIAFLPAVVALGVGRAGETDVFPTDPVARWRRCALSASAVAALTTVVADRPLLPLTIGASCVAAAAALASIVAEARAIRWLREVALSRVEGWSLSETEVAPTGVALTQRGTPDRVDGSYRVDATRGETLIPVAATRALDGWIVSTDGLRRGAGELIAGAALLALLGAVSARTHAPRIYDDDVATSGEYIVEPAPSRAVQAHLRGSARWSRVVAPRVPGITLWRTPYVSLDDDSPVTVAVDAQGREVDTREVMARTRSLPLIQRVRLLRTLSPGFGERLRVREVRDCGATAWVWTSPRGPRADIDVYDLVTGERGSVVGGSATECDERRVSMSRVRGARRR